ncbi:MAG: hypothetical protein UT39_C0020G0008 [Candidatus Woesebacteria bacterium GW2011_GWA1_39_21]|uniref:Uncharacterized protein n=1 Tax=Candidatus Woesebacteria bacterium GW2011_GWA1_39_21 TaxID=1618550 RepID=A0A0G0QIV2_9BACT|nr:MAG: hypothetical protein UT39_C0020G0008 [Candidatus Woesebacteria bacterium GW2011_GWA1_39_21]
MTPVFKSYQKDDMFGIPESRCGLKNMEKTVTLHIVDQPIIHQSI